MAGEAAPESIKCKGGKYNRYGGADDGTEGAPRRLGFHERAKSGFRLSGHRPMPLFGDAAREYAGEPMPHVILQVCDLILDLGSIRKVQVESRGVYRPVDLDGIVRRDNPATRESGLIGIHVGNRQSVHDTELRAFGRANRNPILPENRKSHRQISQGFVDEENPLVSVRIRNGSEAPKPVFSSKAAVVSDAENADHGS